MSGEIPTRTKRPTDAPAASQPGISGVWFDEDDDAKPAKKSRLHSPSSTDLSLYDEVPRRKRWPLVLAGLAVLAIGGVGIAMVMNKGERAQVAPAGIASGASDQAAIVPADAAPSEIIEPPPPDAGVDVAAVPPDAAPPAIAKTPTTPPTTTSASNRRPTGTSSSVVREPREPSTATTTRPTKPSGGFEPPGSETVRRPGGGSTTPTPTPTGSGATPPVVVTPQPPDPGPGSDTTTPPTGVSGGKDGPVDPYGDGAGASGGGAGSAVPPQNRAEAFSDEGSQQLSGGDASSAAASFHKALALDARNVGALIGLGEIALRQGLFGDAAAHLKRAVQLAPRSARVHTLYGEALLGGGQTAAAAAHFRTALQLDPDSARAKQGLAETSPGTIDAL